MRQTKYLHFRSEKFVHENKSFRLLSLGGEGWVEVFLAKLAFDSFQALHSRYAVTETVGEQWLHGKKACLPLRNGDGATRVIKVHSAFFCRVISISRGSLRKLIWSIKKRTWKPRAEHQNADILNAFELFFPFGSTAEAFRIAINMETDFDEQIRGAFRKEILWGKKGIEDTKGGT